MPDRVEANTNVMIVQGCSISAPPDYDRTKVGEIFAFKDKGNIKTSASRLVVECIDIRSTLVHQLVIMMGTPSPKLQASIC